MKRLLALALLVACGDDEAAVPVVADAAVAPPIVDAGTVAEPKGIPLIDWVDDLLDHHTNDDSAPDTVDDKKIVDDENPATFDRRF